MLRSQKHLTGNKNPLNIYVKLKYPRIQKPGIKKLNLLCYEKYNSLVKYHYKEIIFRSIENDPVRCFMKTQLIIQQMKEEGNCLW